MVNVIGLFWVFCHEKIRKMPGAPAFDAKQVAEFKEVKYL
jgi:hypothetical protein